MCVLSKSRRQRGWEEREEEKGRVAVDERVVVDEHEVCVSCEVLVCVCVCVFVCVCVSRLLVERVNVESERRFVSLSGGHQIPPVKPVARSPSAALVSSSVSPQNAALRWRQKGSIGAVAPLRL